MTVAHVYCDVEQLLVGWVPTVVTARAVTELPADLVDVITNVGGVVQVVRFGGPTGPMPGFDHPSIDIDCYALTRPAAKTLAYQVHAAVEYQLPGYLNPYGVVLASETITGPSWRPYENTNVRRVGAAYRLAVRART